MPDLLDAFGGNGSSSSSDLLNAFGNKEQEKLVQQKTIEEADPPLPYMAEGEDAFGRAYYGPGLQGYARKLFANIFNPDFYVPKPSKKQAELIERGAQTGGGMINQLTGWDTWAGKWTGILAEDVGRAAVAFRMTGMEVDEEGNPIEQTGAEEAKAFIQASAKLFYKAGSQGIAVGLDALGLVDKAMRGGQAALTGVDDLGDSSSVLPDITAFDDSTRFGAIANALLRLTPPVAGYNALRVLTNGKSLADNLRVVTDYKKGSDMVYTMWWDEAKKQEYLRRLKAGENPELLEIELQNPWVEMAGSILGDPTTYLGMGVIGQFGKAKTAVKIPFTQKVLFNLPWKTVGRVPGLSEIFHLKNIGKARLAGAADLFTKLSGTDEAALRQLEKVVDDRGALSAIKRSVETVRESVKKAARDYSFFAGDATAKADVMKKTVGTAMRAIASTFRDGDDVGEFVKAAKNIMSDDPRLAAEAFSTLKNYGNLPFSEGGKRMLTFIARLDDEVQIGALLEKHADNLPELLKAVEGKLFGVVDDAFPSVNDMKKAAEEIRTLGKGLDAGEAVKTGDYTKKLLLAKQYAQLPKWVKRSTKMYDVLAGNKVYRGFQSFFAGTYMGLSPAYALRNLQSNTVQIWHDLGGGVAGEALEAGIAAAVPFKGDEIAEAIIKRESDKAAKLLGGAVPTTMGKGVGQAGSEAPAFGALAVGQRIEKAQSAIIIRNVVETEIEKMLRYGSIPDVPNLPAEHANRLKQMVLENYGDTKAALKVFRQEVKNGEFEVFRSLPLDPTFKDWLRKVNKLDELEEIRRTSRSADEFVERMQKLVSHLEDLAKRVADEPAQVSDTNPMGEAVVQVERAIANDNVLPREEVSQFKALTEAYDQLRLSYQNIAQSLKMQLSRMLPESEIRRFDDMFTKTNIEFNEVVGGARDLATGFYEGAYQQSRKGVPASELWDQVRATILDENDNMVRVSLRQAFPDVDPSQLSKQAFQRMAWRWVKDTQSKFWRNYNQSFILKQDQILEEMARVSGTTLDDVKMQYFGGADNPKLVELERLFKQTKEWEEYINPANLKKIKVSGAEAATDAAGKIPKGTKLSQLDLSEVEGFEGGVTHLFNVVNKGRSAKGLDTYATIDDVPYEEALEALKSRIRTPVPPHVGSTMPTTARQLYENLNGGAREALNEFMTTTVKKWGETVPVTDLGDEAEAGIAAFAKEMDKRMVTVRASAMSIADETRNFILHDYNKTYADKFFGMFLQYHYWPSRTYGKWLERAIDTPGTLSAYMKWKDTMSKVHADQPEYFRYNVPVGKLPGMQDSPMYFNLEATLNPINGLTGVDFEDPYRRADWISSTLDDLSKFGFSTFTPISWLVAANLYRKGEDEAGQRWIGRLIPQTEKIKAGLNVLEEKTGIDLMPQISALPGAKYGEFDPFVNVFGDGIDPNEEKRVGRALASMIQQDPSIREKAYDQLLNREGELYDQAVQNAILERAGGQMMSFFLGVGYKNRTEGDIVVDQFYSKYYKLLSIRDQVAPEAYRDAFDQLKEEYPFADAILLSKRGGDDRDGAYAYNVLGRVPPGQDVISDPKLLQKFYDTKGNFSTWTEQEKNRFMADILDAGALLKMPDSATKEDWNEARDANKAIYDQISREMGEEVWDVVNAYYDLKDSNVKSAMEFKEAHPEIAAALTRRMELLQANGEAFAYFGSIDNLEYYFDGKVRAQIKEEYGDLAPLWKSYFDLKVQGKNRDAKMFFRQHPELAASSARKKRLMEEANREFVRIASLLPQREYVTLRDDIDALSENQQAMLENLQPVSTPSFEEIRQVAGEDMSPAMETILQAYWTEGAALSPAATSQLEYLASRYGGEFGATTPESFLRLVGLSLSQPAEAAPPPVTPLSAFGP